AADGLYRAFAAGFLPVPYLGECLVEFERAVKWRTKVIQGGVKVVDRMGQPIPPEERAQLTTESVRSVPQEYLVDRKISDQILRSRGAIN
ncbi:MAG TPA: hypothetical protein VMY18_01530, partial [Acidobacteriota bacterium]|nr:hypothetical protein [Acidobacteriota bacterium]